MGGYPQSNRHNNGLSSSGRQHAGTKLASPFGAPMLNYSMMDFMMPSNGFTSFSSINSLPNGRGGSGNGAVKRTSTSTTFVNGKKLMTKRYALKCTFKMNLNTLIGFNFFYLQSL